ncbi:DNA phosphorothioation-dependent restriction protein DptG [Vibrio harveyi]|uniref:DNA phosphorothioation-dependent restriction protein DptG n=1 Tax=Vibrio harveyi TaxID=669 RepID=UPI0036F38C27
MTMDNYTQPFNSKLPQTSGAVPNKNTLNSYLPIRTKENKHDSGAVVGLVLRSILRKKIEDYKYEDFLSDCKSVIADKSGKPELWEILQEMYFENKDIFSISPELLLFLSQKEQLSAADSRIASMYINLLQNMRIEEFDSKLNFVEQEMLLTLRSKMADEKSKDVGEKPYLPYLSRVFRNDLKFLSSRPKYLLNEIESFLSFYGFAYTAQLSLALNDWRSGEEPVAKPLYFIMDHERASSERTHIKNHGYKLFHESASRLYPMLTMLELLQPSAGEKSATKIPLWEISKGIQESKSAHLKEQLEKFARAFKSHRNLDTSFNESDCALDWLANIMKLAIAQFSVGERFNINKKYVSEIETYLASPFIQNRRRAGLVLVLNQDYIILLTNLAVGEKEKLRFHELISAFKQRGIFVDKQTEQELIKFYERIGNVERMSDSGDAVYVRKTI